MTRGSRTLLMVGVFVSLTEGGAPPPYRAERLVVSGAVAPAAQERSVARSHRVAPVVRTAPRTVRRARRARPRTVPVARSRVTRPPPRTPAPVRPAPPGPPSWLALTRAIVRCPTWHGRGARGLVASSDGHWGTAELATGRIYIGPQVPAARLYDVAVHEWSHVLSVAAYGGDVTAALDAMGGYFGRGDRMLGAERAADCMARLQGAQWTHYTPCADNHWRAGATRLLHRQRL